MGCSVSFTLKTKGPHAAPPSIVYTTVCMLPTLLHITVCLYTNILLSRDIQRAQLARDMESELERVQACIAVTDCALCQLPASMFDYGPPVSSCMTLITIHVTYRKHKKCTHTRTHTQMHTHALRQHGHAN